MTANINASNNYIEENKFYLNMPQKSEVSIVLNMLLFTKKLVHNKTKYDKINFST